MTEDAIGRELRQLREDIRSDLAQIRDDLAKLVPREVHSAELARIGDRVQAAESALRQMDADRATDRRLVWGAILTAVLAVVVQFVTQSS